MIYLSFIVNPEGIQSNIKVAGLDGDRVYGEFLSSQISEKYAIGDLSTGLWSCSGNIMKDSAYRMKGDFVRQIDSSELAAWIEDEDPTLWSEITSIHDSEGNPWCLQPKWNEPPRYGAGHFQSKEDIAKAGALIGRAYSKYETYLNDGKPYRLDYPNECASLIAKLSSSRVSADDVMKGLQERFPNFLGLGIKIKKIYIGGWSIIDADNNVLTVEDLVRKLDRLAE